MRRSAGKSELGGQLRPPAPSTLPEDRKFERHGVRHTRRAYSRFGDAARARRGKNAPFTLEKRAGRAAPPAGPVYAPA